MARGAAASACWRFVYERGGAEGRKPSQLRLCALPQWGRSCRGGHQSEIMRALVAPHKENERVAVLPADRRHRGTVGRICKQRISVLAPFPSRRWIIRRSLSTSSVHRRATSLTRGLAPRTGPDPGLMPGRRRSGRASRGRGPVPPLGGAPRRRHHWQRRVPAPRGGARLDGARLGAGRPLGAEWRGRAVATDGQWGPRAQPAISSTMGL